MSLQLRSEILLKVTPHVVSSMLIIQFPAPDKVRVQHSASHANVTVHD
ncbi:hypothetical protein NYE33_26245 [Paenibacillus sp. FSL R10-2199]